MTRLLLTGGAGFIGSNFALEWCRESRGTLINLDKLTYAGHRENLQPLADNPHHHFVHGDITDRALVASLFARHRPDAVLHLAAESHVDRSIAGPEAFLTTNVMGTYVLLEAAHAYWRGLDADARSRFRFVHVSTDEVYGALDPGEAPSTETHVFAPNSPYAATKAASNHLARAWYSSYGLPVITTVCSNNYGPFQFPEKLIPLVITRALAGESLPIYGDGQQIRDWIYVEDHVMALRRVLEAGVPGETYNIGGQAERTNLAVVNLLCELLDARRPRSDGMRHASLVRHVADRPGHDRRYALDAGKIRASLGFKPRESFKSGMSKTLDWYLGNPAWLARVATRDHQAWLAQQYGGTS